MLTFVEVVSIQLLFKKNSGLKHNKRLCFLTGNGFMITNHVWSSRNLFLCDTYFTRNTFNSRISLFLFSESWVRVNLKCFDVNAAVLIHTKLHVHEANRYGEQLLHFGEHLIHSQLKLILTEIYDVMHVKPKNPWTSCDVSGGRLDGRCVLCWLANNEVILNTYSIYAMFIPLPSS